MIFRIRTIICGDQRCVRRKCVTTWRLSYQLAQFRCSDRRTNSWTSWP